MLTDQQQTSWQFKRMSPKLTSEQAGKNSH